VRSHGVHARRTLRAVHGGDLIEDRPRRLSVCRLIVLVIAATGQANAAAGDAPDSHPLTTSAVPRRVDQLDRERAELAREQQELAARAITIRREMSDLERRRQELLRTLDAEAAVLAARAEQTADEASRRTAAAAAHEAEIEHVLRAGGLWVSFTDEIAPLVRERCVACHTPREPGGGHVLTSYAGFFAEGTHGPAVVPGDAASLLCRIVADGSMPQDGEPLSEAEVALILRWVALGARLDAGADPAAALVRIMPRPPQPPPPEHYPAAVAISAVAFDSTGTRLASSGYHEVLLWEVPSAAEGGDILEPKPRRRLHDLPERIHGLAFHPDGGHLAVAAGTPGVIGETVLLALPHGEALAPATLHRLGVADDAFLAVAFSADGTRLAAVAADQSLRVYDSDARGELFERTDHADWVQAVAFSPAGDRVVTVSRDTTAKVIELASGRLLTTFAGHQEPVTAVCWLRKDGLVASGGADRVVRIWKADSGQEVRRIEGFAGGIEAACLVGTDRLAVADSSGRVRVHAVHDGKQLAEFDAGGSPVTSLAASADGCLLAVGSLDGTLTVAASDGSTPPVRWRGMP
jgi:hypothetical protein